VRMVDPGGAVQSADQRPVFPGSSSGYHTVQVRVG
jgi:hypothetical protein